MDVTKIIAEIDAKIVSLQQARSVLVSLDITSVLDKPRRGRPKGSKNTPNAAKSPKPKRNLSPEGRKRIADAMKKRWAERRDDSAAKSTKK